MLKKLRKLLTATTLLILAILLTTLLTGYETTKIDNDYYKVPSSDLQLLAENADQKLYWESEAEKARKQRDQAQNVQWLYGGAGLVLGFIIAK